jgi:hypothetical protein
MKNSLLWIINEWWWCLIEERFCEEVKTQIQLNNQFVTSNYQTHESCFHQFFPRNFLSWKSWKRQQTFHCSKTERKKICFWPMKSLLSFSIAQTVKKSWKKMGKTKLVVWWIDVTNIIKKFLLCSARARW